MRLEDIPRTSLEVAYELVGNHLLQGSNGANSIPQQLDAIILHAFSHLERHDRESLAHWHINTQVLPLEREKFQQALRSVLVSPDSPWTPNICPTTNIQRLVTATLRGSLPTTSELLQESELLQAIAWKNNPAIMQEVRQTVKNLIQNICQEVQAKNLTPEQSFHMEAIIGDFLALYPYLHPEQNEAIAVPLYKDHAWHIVHYRTEKLSLTPKWMGSPLAAYGLVPESQNQPPLLLFKGTTYPTDNGFFLSLITDLNPFASVGALGFQFGKETLSSWLYEKTQTSGQRALVYGKSLGGAHACRSAIYFPDYVEKVMAYGAPGFSLWDLSRLKEVEQLPHHAQINVFCQQNDPVPYFDLAADHGVNYFKVLGKEVRHGVAAHADFYTTHEHSKILRMEAFHEDSVWMRIGLTALRIFLSLTLFPILILIHAGQTLTRKIIKQIYRHITPTPVQQEPPII